jgi:hypothetical protein
MPPELWFGPNIGSLDLLDLFSKPDLWKTTRKQVSTVQLYAQHIEYDAPFAPAMNGPNHWKSLSDVKALDLLKGWGLGLTIEMGAVKFDANNSKACTGEAYAQTAITVVIPRVIEAGGSIAAFAIDEALDSGLNYCGQKVGETVGYTARFITNLQNALVGSKMDTKIGMIEPYPKCHADVIIQFMEGLQQAGASPRFLHLDVDRRAFVDDHIPDEQVSRDLRSLQFHCTKWGIPFGVIIDALRADSDKAYYDNALHWQKRLRGLLGAWPDRLIVQSFADPDKSGLKKQPHNLPETANDSHTGLISAVQKAVGATA